MKQSEKWRSVRPCHGRQAVQLTLRLVQRAGDVSEPEAARPVRGGAPVARPLRRVRAAPQQQGPSLYTPQHVPLFSTA